MLSGELGWIYVYPDPARDLTWMLSFDVPSQRWTSMNDDWFLQGGGVLPVPVGDSSVFPLHVTSRLPLAVTGQILAVEIEDPG